MAATGSLPRALLGRYELREQVGAGGMGEVWLGWDRRLQRDVAVKLLLPQLSDEPSFRQRFGVEARAAAALDHPNVVSVYDIDDDEGSLFIVMERLPGPSLDRRLAEGPLDEEEVLRLAADLLAGLGAAHAENLVHRDIKPGNLIRSAGGRWKVGDFGVAKDMASAASLTLVGVAVGTPAYLAPEQLEGRPATPSSDLWAAGIVLREALLGHRPFAGDDPIAVAHAVRHTPLTPLAQLRPDLSPDLTRAVDRSLSRDATLRFTSAPEMRAAIEGRPPPIPPAPPVGAAAPVPAPPPVPASAAVPSGARPSAPGPPASTRPSWVPVLWVVTGVGAVILLLLLVGLLIGAIMVGEDELEEPPPVTTTEAPPATAPPATAPPVTEAPAADPIPSSTRPAPPTTSSLPGDEPVGPGVGGTDPTSPDEELAPDGSDGAF